MPSLTVLHGYHAFCVPEHQNFRIFAPSPIPTKNLNVLTLHNFFVLFCATFLLTYTLADASIQYRQCFDSQVIKSKPKSKQKVERGTSVLVKYITQEVIDESQRMYEFAEKHKAELLYAKSMHHAEQKEKTKRVVTEVYNAVKRNLTKIPAKFHKKEDQDEQK